jgi:hypothetical protein
VGKTLWRPNLTGFPGRFVASEMGVTRPEILRPVLP